MYHTIEEEYFNSHAHNTTALQPNLFVTVIQTDDLPPLPAQTTTKTNSKIMNK
jgi:hypothetical protein